MVLVDNAKVGSKGEILPKKSLREFAGFFPGDRVVIEAENGQLIIRKILSVDEVLSLPTILNKTVEEIEELIKKETSLYEGN